MADNVAQTRKAAATAPSGANGLVLIVWALFALSLLICAYIVGMPWSKSDEGTASLAAPTPPDAPVVTRNRDTTDPLDALALAFAELQDPLRDTAGQQRQPAPDSVGDDVAQLSQGVLLALGQVGSASPGPEGDAIGLSALDAILAATGRRQGANAYVTLEGLVARALQQGHSDASVDILLNAAAARGDVVVPAGLRRTDGRVDTDTVLNGLATKSALVMTPPARPDLSGLEIRMTQTATATEDHLFYTVAEGDSLGAIALRYLGNAARATQIYEANRTHLSSPDMLRVGQRLVIPRP